MSVLSASGLLWPAAIALGALEAVVVLTLLLVGAEEGPGMMLVADIGSLQYFSAREMRSRTLFFSCFRISQSVL